MAFILALAVSGCLEIKLDRFRVYVSSVLIAICSAALANAASARGNGSIAAGRELAVQACSDCHVVARDQKSPPMLDQHVPSFEEIANRPSTSEKSLQKFIATTRWDRHTYPIKMPNMWLTQDQTGGIIAYILSMRGSNDFSMSENSPIPTQDSRRKICLDKCVADVHSRCIIGYCLHRQSIWIWFERASSAIKTCQAQC